jgi:hypothetical protein
MASIDFFTVPTLTFRVLFVFVVLSPCAATPRGAPRCDGTPNPGVDGTAAGLDPTRIPGSRHRGNVDLAPDPLGGS